MSQIMLDSPSGSRRTSLDGNYRDRIYSRYRTVGHQDTRPGLAAFASQAPYIRALIRKHFPSDRSASIIDLGCGAGALIHFARTAGYLNIVGVDYSAEQVEEASRIGIPGIQQGDLMETLRAMADASQDLVLTLDVIEHLNRNELMSLVDEVHRVVRPGGRWIIHTVNGEGPFFGGIRYGDMTHEMAYTRRSLRQLMLASGFRDVQCFEDVPIIHSLKSALRHLLWRGIRFGWRMYLMAETGNTGSSAIFSQNLVAVVAK
jgi:SAM-dependent methyltransferase